MSSATRSDSLGSVLIEGGKAKYTIKNVTIKLSQTEHEVRDITIECKVGARTQDDCSKVLLAMAARIKDISVGMFQNLHHQGVLKGTDANDKTLPEKVTLTLKGDQTTCAVGDISATHLIGIPGKPVADGVGALLLESPPVEEEDGKIATMQAGMKKIAELLTSPENPLSASAPQMAAVALNSGDPDVSLPIEVTNEGSPVLDNKVGESKEPVLKNGSNSVDAPEKRGLRQFTENATALASATVGKAAAVAVKNVVTAVDGIKAALKWVRHTFSTSSSVAPAPSSQEAITPRLEHPVKPLASDAELLDPNDSDNEGLTVEFSPVSLSQPDEDVFRWYTQALEDPSQVFVADAASTEAVCVLEEANVFLKWMGREFSVAEKAAGDSLLELKQLAEEEKIKREVIKKEYQELASKRERLDKVICIFSTLYELIENKEAIAEEICQLEITELKEQLAEYSNELTPEDIEHIGSSGDALKFKWDALADECDRLNVKMHVMDATEIYYRHIKISDEEGLVNTRKIRFGFAVEDFQKFISNNEAKIARIKAPEQQLDLSTVVTDLKEQVESVKSGLSQSKGIVDGNLERLTKELERCRKFRDSYDADPNGFVAQEYAKTERLLENYKSYQSRLASGESLEAILEAAKAETYADGTEDVIDLKELTDFGKEILDKVIGELEIKILAFALTYPKKRENFGYRIGRLEDVAIPGCMEEQRILEEGISALEAFIGEIVEKKTGKIATTMSKPVVSDPNKAVAVTPGSGFFRAKV